MIEYLKEDEMFSISINDMEPQTLNLKEEFLRYAKDLENKTQNKDKKVYPDPIIRKAKKCLFDTILDYLNYAISLINGKKGYISKYETLLKINYDQIKDATTMFNRNLLKTPVKDIFSVDISGKFTIYDKDHNKKLIEGYLQSLDEEKREKFEIIFNKNFSEYIGLIAGKKEIDGLEGLIEKFNFNLKNIKNCNKEEITCLIIKDYESLFNNKKKPRKKK